MNRICMSLATLLLLAACGGGGGGGDPETGPYAAILYVTNLNDAGPGSLRDAIENAPENGGVFFDPELPVGTINLTSEIIIERSITIGGLSGTWERFTVSGGGTTGIFRAPFGADPKPHLELRNLVLTDAQAQFGGAVRGGFETLICRRVFFLTCRATLGTGSGGAIYFDGSSFLAADCAFTNCHARNGGAMYISSADGFFQFERCSFYLNSATVTGGGAVRQFRGTSQYTNCSFFNNTAVGPQGGQGGALHIHSHFESAAECFVHACTFADNTALIGGGIFLDTDVMPAALHIHDSIVAGNSGGPMPDVHTAGLATADGGSNVLSVGSGTLVDGFYGNIAGTGFAPLDAQLDIIEFHDANRAYRMPQAASPAVDMIPPGTLANADGAIEIDQRGFPRDAGGISDIGAVER